MVALDYHFDEYFAGNDIASPCGLSATSNTTHNGLNQIATRGGANLSYDGRGNLISDGTSAYGILIKSKCRASIFVSRIFGAKNRKHFFAKCSGTYTYNIDNQLLTATKANITRAFEFDAETALNQLKAAIEAVQSLSRKNNLPFGLIIMLPI